MKIFEILGIVNLKNLDLGSGRPMFYIEIKPEFQEILNAPPSKINPVLNPKNSLTQGLNELEKPNPSKSKGVRDDYFGYSAQDFVKNQEKKPHAHPKDELEKDNPSKINPVCDVCKDKNANFTQDNKTFYCKKHAYEMVGGK